MGTAFSNGLNEDGFCHGAEGTGLRVPSFLGSLGHIDLGRVVARLSSDKWSLSWGWLA
jgi:hypothetical protein